MLAHKKIAVTVKTLIPLTHATRLICLVFDHSEVIVGHCWTLPVE